MTRDELLEILEQVADGDLDPDDAVDEICDGCDCIE